MTKPLWPTRAQVLAAAQAAADAHQLAVDDVLAVARFEWAVEARVTAFRQLAAQGYSAQGIARVWGVSPTIVERAVGRQPRPKPQAPESHLPREWGALSWQYGDARARRIATGQDDAHQRELETWKGLGGRRG